jgi:osmotically-inducible protein OsmY
MMCSLLTAGESAETGTAAEADREIIRAVRAALQGIATVPHERIQVSVADRWVTLTGTVDRWSQQEAVERAVRRVARVRGCLSAITVRGGRARGTRDRRSAPRRWRNKQPLPTPG